MRSPPLAHVTALGLLFLMAGCCSDVMTMAHEQDCESSPPTGCIDLGYAYYHGEDADGNAFDKDREKAAYYLGRAYDHGATMFEYGAMLADGDGTPKDVAKAYEVYQKLCNHGIGHGPSCREMVCWSTGAPSKTMTLESIG